MELLNSIIGDGYSNYNHDEWLDYQIIDGEVVIGDYGEDSICSLLDHVIILYLFSPLNSDKSINAIIKKINGLIDNDLKLPTNYKEAYTHRRFKPLYVTDKLLDFKKSLSNMCDYNQHIWNESNTFGIFEYNTTHWHWLFSPEWKDDKSELLWRIDILINNGGISYFYRPTKKISINGNLYKRKETILTKGFVLEIESLYISSEEQDN